MKDVICVGADFEGGYPRLGDVPLKPRFPEVAFLGRSNVGKSSLLNSLVQRKKLARSGKTPGVTRAINTFIAELQSGGKTRRRFRLVDLPGFGFAKVSAREQAVWVRELGDYITNRADLNLVLLLVDSRRGLQDTELEILGSLEKEIWIVLTKIDEIPRAKRLPLLQKVAVESGFGEDRIFVVSAEKHEGVDELRSVLFASVGEDR